MIILCDKNILNIWMQMDLHMWHFICLKQDTSRKMTEFERYILSIEKGNIVSRAYNGSSTG